MDSTPAAAYIPATMTDSTQAPSSSPAPSALSGPVGVARTIVGGVLMGIANLIPGISGGTMILAMGLYTEFIDSVADVSRFQFSPRRIAFLAVVGAAAGTAIFGLAGLILYLLFHYSTAMYALFIGLTLGGAPKLASMLRPTIAAWIATAGGIALMAGIALLKTGGMPQNTIMDVVAGLVGATTMVLPGISGSYMLLVLDQYDRVIGAIHDRDFRIIIPVGIGAVVGIVALSNALKFLLHRHKTVTIGFLLGMLLGSVLGLWPFGREPREKLLDGRQPTELRAFAAKHSIPGVEGAGDGALRALIVENWKDRQVDDYAPAAIATASAMLLVGFAATFVLARERRRPAAPNDSASAPPGAP